MMKVEDVSKYDINLNAIWIENALNKTKSKLSGRILKKSKSREGLSLMDVEDLLNVYISKKKMTIRKDG